MKHVDKFFAYARERYSILLKKRAGKPRPWTEDPILDTYKFCNIFREDDRTTEWFRNHVRQSLTEDPQVLLATVVFRMFNRITTGEALFSQIGLFSKEGCPNLSNAFTAFQNESDWHILRRAIKTYCGPDGPYVTGAYVISSPAGSDKLTGICRVLGNFAKNTDWRAIAIDCLHRPTPYTLYQIWEFLKERPYLGPFHSYEIVTDLRHTHLLRRAPDINLWANPGPGARRGLNRIHDMDIDHRERTDHIIREMCEILEFSRGPAYWPPEWPIWELRDVEHTLCEFDKYERTRKGEGRPRSTYR